MDELWVIILFIAGTVVSAFSQIILKIGAQKDYKGLKVYLNPYVIIGYTLFFAVTLLTVFCYRYIDLSLGGLISSLSYAFVAILSRLFLKETLNIRQIIAVILIVSGVSISILL